MPRQINKILFITLSNIGDVILTLPVLDSLRASYPKSKITVMVGPRAKEIFENDLRIDRLIVYDKYSRLGEKIKLFQELKKERFDLVIDLRNTLYGALLPARYRTSPFLYIPSYIRHMKDRNLYRLQMALKSKRPLSRGKERSFCDTDKDRDYVNVLLKRNKVDVEDGIVIVSPGTGGDTRRWHGQKFAQLCTVLSRDYKVILIGAQAHQSIAQYIYQNCTNKIFDFTGQTTLSQLTYLLKRSSLLITCDTGTLQLASYLDTPIVALFGPSDEKKYGPWSTKYRIVSKEIVCRPCKKAHCRFGSLDCMGLVKVEDVLRESRSILVTGHEDSQVTGQKYNFKRILIVRTDRIGDVLLSTPAIKSLRDNYPNAYIAVMVSPYAKDIVDGNPYLDKVIIYDKDGKHKKWYRSIKFALNLKKEKFDLAIVLHPTNRAHLAVFLAGIPKRIGYNRKLGFLLTNRIRHTKQFGQRHEIEYNFDLLRDLGIGLKDKSLFMPIRPDSEKKIEELFSQEGIKASDKLLAIHPGASCPSKIWPAERFAQVADRLVEKYNFKILVIAGPKDMTLAQNMLKNMRHPVINLAGKISVSQLASVLKRCQLFISNDSGPVHLASAVGAPVISIFGRNQKGLSPKRWGPVGGRDKVLHKEVGCLKCLAHNCKRDFACLKAISVDEVVAAADEILRS